MHVFTVSCFERIRTIHATKEHAEEWLRKSGFTPSPTANMPERWKHKSDEAYRWVYHERVLGS